MKKELIEVFILKSKNIKYNKYTKLLSEHRLNRIKDANSNKYINEQITGELFLLYSLYKLNSNLEIPLKIEIPKNNKPYIKDLNYFYNISHSNNYFSIAVAKNDIGIDSELLTRNINNLENKILTAKELKLYDNNKTNLLKTWVKKEAIVKLYGKETIKNLKRINTLTTRSTYKNDIIYIEEIYYKDLYTVVAAKKEFKINLNIIDELSLKNFLTNLLKEL